MTNVYILDFGNRIKIGKSNRLKQRITAIENAVGEKVKQVFHLETESTKEKILQTYLQEYRTVGEYFNCSFDTAKSAFQDILDGKIKLERKKKPVVKRIRESRKSRTLKSGMDYNKLWKLLIERGMNKTELRLKIGMGTSTLAKLGKEEIVDMQSLLKICDTLNCSLSDIVEYTPNAKATE